LAMEKEEGSRRRSNSKEAEGPAMSASDTERTRREQFRV
jgi:hypothetical protein